jgi:alkanesulfonate monooxygenase SsuD/methylene tetrahydromethanopterin reductase-like flavin-dependent oxidoreductase (luciferase family)
MMMSAGGGRDALRYGVIFTTTRSQQLAEGEEYAVIDCISGGRLIAGLPTGLGNDVSVSNGITPMEHRERWREGVDFILKAGRRRSSLPGTGNTRNCPKSICGRVRYRIRTRRS